MTSAHVPLPPGGTLPSDVSAPIVSTRTVTLENVTEWIQTGTPFTLTRWGDGEWHAVFGRKHGHNCSGQDYVPKLGKHLRRVLRQRPTYLLELKKWEKVFGDRVDTWLLDEGLDSLDWIAPDILHRASAKGRLAPVIAALQEAPDFLVIGPAHLRAAQGTLGFRRMIEVPSTNAFSALDFLRAQAFTVAATLPRGAVISVSASMAANILVDDLYRRFGSDLIIIDTGSLWDPYAGVLSRSYMRNEAFRLSV